MKLKTNNDCCACSYCYRACPVGAPYYDGEQVQIDNDKCIGCGKCMKACPMGAIYDQENPPKAAQPHEPITYQADALIIGAGGSGMLAAVRIAQETGKKVIVLEKAKRTGAGAIHVAGPMQFSDTKWAMDKGAKATNPDKIKSMQERSAGILDPELIANTMNAQTRFFDWMCTWADMTEKFELSEGRGGGPGGPGGPGGGPEGGMPGGPEGGMPGGPGGGSEGGMPGGMPGGPGGGSEGGMPGGMPGGPGGGSEGGMPGGMPGGPGGGPEGGMPGGPGPDAVQAGGESGGFIGGAMGGGPGGGMVVDTKSLCPPSPAFHNPGQFIFEKLFDKAKEYDITILNETPAQDFILNEAGDVIGVKAKDPGGEVDVYCDCILVAAGSLLLGRALKKVQPDYADAWMPRFAHAINVFTGDGVDMLERIGVPIDYDNIWLNITGALSMPCDALTVEYAEATGKEPLINTDLRAHANRPEALMVNLEGNRWGNEQYQCINVKKQIKQPQGVSYSVYTEKTIKMQPMAHKPLYDENGKRLSQMVPLTMRQAWNEERMQWWASRKNNHLVIADTIEEMAQKIGMPVENLKATVAKYNEACAKGVDEEFGKDPDYLKPLDEGPFYAVRTFLMSDGAEGGIFIDANCQVKGKDGKLMKGLYAAGDNTSGNIVNAGDRRMGITNEYSWAICSGMIAADSMIRQLKGE